MFLKLVYHFVIGTFNWLRGRQFTFHQMTLTELCCDKEFHSSFYLHFYGAGVQLCTFKAFLFTSALKEWIPLMDHRNQPHSLVYLCKWVRMAHFIFIADVGNEFGDDPGKVAIYHFFNKFNPLELSIHLPNDGLSAVQFLCTLCSMVLSN